MIAFLSSGKLQPPKLVATAPEDDAENVGFVVPSFKHGCLILQDEQDRCYRLQWGPDGSRDSAETAAPATSDRRRALPAGKYTLSEYRIVRKDDQGQTWFICSGSAKGVRELVIRPGEKHRVAVTDAITMGCRARWKGSQVGVATPVLGEPRCGLTIYRDGRRIAIGYAVTDPQGAVLADGTMRYG